MLKVAEVMHPQGPGAGRAEEQPPWRPQHGTLIGPQNLTSQGTEKIGKGAEEELLIPRLPLHARCCAWLSLRSPGFSHVCAVSMPLVPHGYFIIF